MNALTNLMSAQWAQAFGWTLVHSVWESLLCVVCIVVALRCISPRHSNTRYLVAAGGMLLIFILSIGTFIYLSSKPWSQPMVGPTTPLTQSLTFSANSVDQPAVSRLLQTMDSVVQRNISFILIIWTLGATIFSFRIIGGWWYVERLRHHGIEVTDTWNQYVQHLARSLGIGSQVALLESSRIQAPIVMGYLKPVILVPLGMFSGLSTDQLETIFTHELIHIKRGDYLVNIAQSILEGLYFFNPFVWMISGIVRREREHCCDDAVVNIHGNPLAYARALTTLEQVRLENSGLALSLANDNKQLLTRIKRIMEKSVQHYSTRERIIPAILLVVGLLCASWISVQSGKSENDLMATAQAAKVAPIATDTLKKRNGKKSSPQDVTVDIPQEIEVIESLDVYPMVEDIHFDIDLAPLEAIPDIDVMLAPLVELGLRMEIDSIPSMARAGDRDWEEFSKTFQKNFSENFGEFYQLHGEELRQMMEEMRNKLDNEFNEEWREELQEKVQRHEAQARAQVEVLTRNQAELVEQAASMETLARNMKHWEEEHAKKMRELEKEMKAVEDSMKALEIELKEQLIRDGYLKASETLEQINIHDDILEINGKRIKAADQKKYQELLKRFSTLSKDEHKVF